MQSEGIVGLAPSNALNKESNTLFVETLFNKGVIDQNLFSFSIGRGLERNKVMLGGYDLQKHAAGRPISWHKLISDKYWSIPLGSAFYGSEALELTTDRVIVDTGTSYTLIPSEELEGLTKVIERKIPNLKFHKDYEGMYTAQCDS